MWIIVENLPNILTIQNIFSIILNKHFSGFAAADSKFPEDKKQPHGKGKRT